MSSFLDIQKESDRIRNEIAIASYSKNINKKWLKTNDWCIRRKDIIAVYIPEMRYGILRFKTIYGEYDKSLENPKKVMNRIIDKLID